MAIVWPCRLSVAEYAAAGKRIDVPRQACPDCGRTLAWWSGYWRWLRDRVAVRVWVRRGRCRTCRRTHVLLPDLVHERRLDSVEVIGEALERSIGGRGMRKVAAAIDVPTSTVRDWRRRHRARAPALLARFAGLAVGLGDDLADLPTTLEAAALAALAAAWARARDRVAGVAASMWRFWNVVCGGRGLVTNTSPRLGTARTPG
ncbi:MAG: DUF6431 domain-containing protein [Planctomycetota bacterium]|nr:DUF6431 domain-containing protein [Planctomycetota bacterium]